MRSRLMVFVFIVLFVPFASPDSADIGAGYIHGLDLESISATSRWAGIFGSLSGSSLTLSPYPFHSFTAGSASVYQISSLPGNNLKDGNHYFALMPVNTSFDVTNVLNVSSSDLLENGLFNQSNFPHFHPDYYSKADNANETFCCNTQEFAIDGSNYTGFTVTLPQSITYGVLKYQYNATHSFPLFMVELDDYTCLGSESCNYEFLIPYDKTYYFYAVSKLPAYDITTYIDGVQDTEFERPALPYNLTIVATSVYGGSPVSNLTVAVLERNGNNLFIPLRMSGITSMAFSAGRTDANGQAQFVAVPTEYPEINDYSISAAILSDDLESIWKEENLSIDIRGSIVGEKKALSPEELSNDGKVAVNAINSLVSSLYYWANTDEQALNHDITVYNNGTISPASVELGTGAPNVIRVRLRDSGTGSLISGYVRMDESQGFLVLHPPIGSEGIIGSKDRIHREFFVSTGNYFLVTPTNNPPASSELILKVYDASYSLVGNFSSPEFEATNSISDEGTGTRGGYQTLNANELKTTINAMASIGSNLYYALN